MRSTQKSALLFRLNIFETFVVKAKKYIKFKPSQDGRVFLFLNKFLIINPVLRLYFQVIYSFGKVFDFYGTLAADFRN